MTTTRHTYTGPLSSIWCVECGKGRAAHETHETWLDRQAKEHAAAEAAANKAFFAENRSSR